ncbi:MAG: hypothetical protein ACREM1_17315 [Longimicrobiales bacterium]
MNGFQRWTLTLAAAGVVAACGGPGAQEDAGTEGDAAGAEEAPMPGMPGMQGMQDRGMMDEMQAHMQMMQNMSADNMMGMMPEHRQMVANMLAQMNRDMGDMNRETDTAWDATVDSLRQDLARMPEMSGQELQEFMPEHHRRVMSLMDMHRRMMGSMRM